MSSSVFLGASHAARRVACYGMRSHQRESVSGVHPVPWIGADRRTVRGSSHSFGAV